jgi:hypothetical protein
MSETTRIIAQILGPFLLFVGFFYTVRPDWARGVYAEFAGQRALTITGGVIALLLGLILVRVHDDWSNPPAIVISLIGALAVARGALAVTAPSWVNGATRALAESRAFAIGAGALTTALGAFLLYYGIVGA